VKLPERLPLTKEEEARAWASWYTHPLRAAFHNDLVSKLELDRDALEECPPDKLCELQTRIRLRRQLLDYIHRKDPPPKPK